MSILRLLKYEATGLYKEEPFCQRVPLKTIFQGKTIDSVSKMCYNFTIVKNSAQKLYWQATTMI